MSSFSMFLGLSCGWGRHPVGEAIGCQLGAQDGPQPGVHLLFLPDLGHVALAGPIYPVCFPHISPLPDPDRGSQMSQLHLCSCPFLVLSLACPCLHMRTDVALRIWGQEEACCPPLKTGVPVPALLSYSVQVSVTGGWE